MIFHPENTKLFNDNLLIIKDFIVNYYLYKKGDSIIVVDTGYGLRNPEKYLIKYNFNKKLIKAIFITHSDVDHIGGLKYFPDVPLYMGKGEEKLVKRDVPRFFGFKYNKRIKRDYKLLKDEEIKIGDINIKAISTEGHTTGHTAYLVDERYLFTGDLLNIKNGKFYPFFRILNMDNKKLYESFNKLMKVKDNKMVFTAHSGYINFDKNEK